ncbi:MAG TPA: hypothetical protein VFZ48_02085 [Candidatus Saccharimonadales bacterium]
MNGQESARQLIDRIAYLASLVSEPRTVDVTLDKLRIITSRASQPTPNDIQSLTVIQTDLEDYLVTKERLRTFTKASLQSNVERHFAAKNPLWDIRKAALTRIFATIGVCIFITGLLAALGLMEGQVVLAFFICTLFVGLALLFHSIKKDLVAQLHESVNYLMAATIGTGLFALNFPIIAASSYLESHPMFQHGGFLAMAIPVYGFYYLAFYIYAKQLKVVIPWLLRPTGVAVSAILVAVIAAILPHPIPATHEIFFDLAVIGFGVSVYFSTVAAILGFKSLAKTTEVYGKSTLFLAISMVLHTIGNGNFLIFVTFISGDFSVNEQKGQILTGFFIVAALAFQYAAAYKSKTALK